MHATLLILLSLFFTNSPMRASQPTPDDLAGCREELIFQIVRPNLARMLRTIRELQAHFVKLDVPKAEIAAARAAHLGSVETSALELRRLQEVTRAILQDALQARVSARKEQTDELIHDLGNVLCPVGYTVSLFKIQPDLGEKGLKELLRMANTGLDKGMSLIKDRIIPVISKTKFVPLKALINVNDVLTPVQALYRLSDPPVSVEIEKTQLTIVANDLDIFTAISNLSRNAQEAITSHQNGRGHIAVRAFRENQFVVIEVKDNGPGIPQDSQTRLLQRNQSEKGAGRGVGLSSVQRTVFDNNGEFYFTSETEGPERGTTFQLRFLFAELTRAEE